MILGVVAYIQYSDHPKHYRICKADKYLRNFSDPVDIKGSYGSSAWQFHENYQERVQNAPEMEPRIKKI